VNTGRIATHLEQDSLNGFTLTDAIRPGPAANVLPREGYRTQVYRDRNAGLRMPMLSAAVSRERLFDAFLALMEPLGDSLHVVLESSHQTRRGGTVNEFRRHGMDKPVLLSHFCEFEDLLLNDGCTGLAVMSRKKFVEVQFDEHKLLHVYAKDLRPYKRALRSLGIRKRELLPLISEAEHLHHTTDEYADRFQQLCAWVGVENFEGVTSGEIDPGY
jgi:hypothetical protein